MRVINSNKVASKLGVATGRTRYTHAGRELRPHPLFFGLFRSFYIISKFYMLSGCDDIILQNWVSTVIKSLELILDLKYPRSMVLLICFFDYYSDYTFFKVDEQ